MAQNNVVYVSLFNEHTKNIQQEIRTPIKNLLYDTLLQYFQYILISMQKTIIAKTSVIICLHIKNSSNI